MPIHTLPACMSGTGRLRDDVNDTLTRLRTALAGRYVIEREVGAGGMARV